MNYSGLFKLKSKLKCVKLKFRNSDELNLVRKPEIGRMASKSLYFYSFELIL